MHKNLKFIIFFSQFTLMYQSGIIKKYLGNSREIVVDIGSGSAIDNYLEKIAKDEGKNRIWIFDRKIKKMINRKND